MDSIAPTYALFLVQELQNRRLDKELLEATQLTLEILESGADIPLTSFQQLLLNAESLCPDTPVGLIIGRRAHIMTLGPIGVAAATAPNAREGLMALEAFSHLHASYSQVTLRSTLQGVRIEISFLGQIPETERLHTESLFFMLQHYIEMVTGEPLTTASFNARHSKPSYHEIYDQWIHSPTTFNNDQISIDIPREHLDKHSPFYNPSTWKQTLQTLSQRVRELGKSNSHSYKQYVLSLLYSYEPPLPAVSFAAERLHISERTLNRRLQKENTNFRELKSQVMQFWAEQYLQDTELSVEAIANLLGYQDTANFRRAFRNHKHCSPQEYRKRFSDLARANTLGPVNTNSDASVASQIAPI